MPSSLYNNLVAYWSMDENVTGGSRADSHNLGPYALADPNNNVGSITAKLGRGANLTGGGSATTNPYLVIPNSLVNSNLTNAGSGGFTFAAWVYMRSYQNYQRLLDLGTGTDHFVIIASESTGSRLLTQINWNGNSWNQFVSNFWDLNAWIHITMNFTDTTVSVYKNATLVSQYSTGRRLNEFGSLTNCWLGRSQFSGDGMLDAIIDEVAIWNRGLTGAEVWEVYNGGLGRTYADFANANDPAEWGVLANGHVASNVVKTGQQWSSACIPFCKRDRVVPEDRMSNYYMGGYFQHGGTVGGGGSPRPDEGLMFPRGVPKGS